MANRKVKHYDGTDESEVKNDSSKDYGIDYSESTNPGGSLADYKPAPSKPAIVTKEQLASSGYDNLRDYLNAQHGWKRRESPNSVTVEKTTVSKAAPEPSFEDRVNAIKESKGYPVSYANKVPQGSSSGNKGPGGESNIDSTEFSRNVKNTLNALTPLGGGIGKIGAELALAGRGAKTASKVAEVAEKGREAVTNPVAWTGGPKAMKTIQKVEDVARKAATRSARIKKPLSEFDTTGGATGYKKGGSISSRGDGIARKGHTKGKYL